MIKNLGRKTLAERKYGLSTTLFTEINLQIWGIEVCFIKEFKLCGFHQKF